MPSDHETAREQRVEVLAWIIHRASGCGLYPTPVGISDDVCPPDREDFDAARDVLDSPAMRDLLAEAWDRGHSAHAPVLEFGDTPCFEPNPYRETSKERADD